MPTTRRSAASTRNRAGPTRGQSTISFSNRVTKDIPRHVKKENALSSPRVEAQDPENPSAAELEPPFTQESSVDAVTKDEEAEAGEIGHSVRSLDLSQDKGPSPGTRQETEVEADKVTDAQIRKYWVAVQKKRKAPTVHLEGVDVWEKALRHFDVSSQYGPCIGIPRSKRWQRAQRLGLNPPIEILAIIQKEAKLGHRDAQTAQMDRIMNATALAIN